MIYFQQPIRPPFRAEVVGAVTPSPSLAEAVDKCKSGVITTEELDRVSSLEVERFVKELYELGFEEVTDGGLRGEIPAEWILGSTPGQIEFPNIGRLVGWYNGLLAVTPFGCVARQDLVAPAQLYAESKANGMHGYISIEMFAADLVRACVNSIIALYEVGCRSILLTDSTWESEQWGELADINNRVLAALPADMVVAIRPSLSFDLDERKLDVIAQRMACEKVRSLYIDITTHNHLQLLNSVGSKRKVVLGLVSTLTETPDDATIVSGLIREASRMVSMERMSVSNLGSLTNGVASDSGMRHRKLALLQELVEENW